MKEIFFTICLIFSMMFVNVYVYAEPVKITESNTRLNVIYDGKWSFTEEWKQSSLNSVSDPGKSLHIRSAHYENFIYIFLDYVGGNTEEDVGNNSIICLDADNKKELAPNGDEICFKLQFKNKQATTNRVIITNNATMLTPIPNHEDLIAISSLSDENDRYSKVPHPGYEFRIPIDLFGRSNNYGFMVMVNDIDVDDSISWPENITEGKQIPHPSIWGDIISPDNTLPEFSFSYFMLFILPILLTTFFVMRNRGIQYY